MSVKKFAVGSLMLAALLAVLTGCSGGSSSAPAATQIDPATTPAQIFFILRNDNGESGDLVGCGDSLIGQDLPTTLANTTMQDALTAQLAVRDEQVGDQGLYNPLSRCDLTVESVEQADDGTVTVNMSGTVMGGTICDQIRMRAQIAQCLWQFGGVTDIELFVNNQDFQTALTRAPSPDIAQ